MLLDQNDLLVCLGQRENRSKHQRVEAPWGKFSIKHGMNRYFSKIDTFMKSFFSCCIQLVQ